MPSFDNLRSDEAETRQDVVQNQGPARGVFKRLDDLDAQIDLMRQQLAEFGEQLGTVMRKFEMAQVSPENVGLQTFHLAPQTVGVQQQGFQG